MDARSPRSTDDDRHADQRRIDREVLRSGALLARAGVDLAREKLAEVRERADEREWLHAQVATMLADGWTGEELARVGITADWLRSVGFLLFPFPLPPSAPQARPGALEAREGAAAARQRLCARLRTRAELRESRIRGTYEALDGLRASVERRWMRAQVAAMEADGWSAEALAGIGVTPERVGSMATSAARG